MKQLCNYADVFYGNGATDRFFEDGLASKWFYIKALCGNTHPHATLPFGRMSVGAYSGAYPTGYGTHWVNSCGGIKKLHEKQVARGFSHLHQTGTGGIRYYYNYAIASPIYGEVANALEFRPLTEEQGTPGYYEAMLDDIRCRMTVDGGAALHQYIFPKDGGRVAIDLSNDGLSKQFKPRFRGVVGEPKIERIAEDEVSFSGIFSGIRLYFCVYAKGASATLFCGNDESREARLSPAEDSDFYGAIFDFEGKELLLRVGYSTRSFEEARKSAKGSECSFEEAKAKSAEIWEKHFSAIQIETDDEELKGKFYSNLYHSLLKPADLQGESVLGVEGDVVGGFATLWDQYKTVLPLLYLCYPDMGKKVAKALTNISETMGKICCSFGITEFFPCENQAKMLGIITLCDAYHFGLTDAATISECAKRELAREDFEPFLKDGLFEYYTHILDAAETCLYVADLTEDQALKEQLLSLGKHWRNAYGPDGLLSDKSDYYEGDRYTYSFRIHKEMDERIALSGGKEAFAKQLDDFFGFDKESVKPITHIGALKEIEATAYHRFEGFNNECDMDAPYAYIYADRHDRLCEILRECVTRSFGTGKNGLPGNNDSGGLSSAFVWNVIGIFPLIGSGKFLLGMPQVDKVTIPLQDGKVLTIRTEKGGEHRCVDRIEFNGKMVEGYQISAEELLQGGELVFYTK